MNDLDGARIVGVYTTEQARSLAPRTGFSVALQALNGALDDAGMTLDEIDGFGSFVSADWPPSDSTWAYQLDTAWKWAGAGIGVRAVLDAARLISSGYLNAVALVFGGVRPASSSIAPWTVSHSEFSGWVGAVPDQPVQFGLVAQRYIHEVGPHAWDAMAEAAATIRNFGHINPDAVFAGRGPFTADDVKQSRMVVDPLTLLMCSAITDGGCAVILARKDRPESGSKPPVRVVTGATLTAGLGYTEPQRLEGYYELGQHYRDTLTRAGVTNDDIDVIEFYDHFSSHVLLQLEQFGFCGKGEAPELVLSGQTRLGGAFPTCTDGGNHSFSHPGYPVLFRFIEAVRQLRGEVKDLCPGWEQGEHTYDPAICRKVRDAELAFVTDPGDPRLMGGMTVLGVG